MNNENKNQTSTEGLGVKKKNPWKIILFIVLGLIVVFFLLQIAKNTIPKILDSAGKNVKTDLGDFPQTLEEQKSYIYDYLKNKGSSKELTYLGYDKPTADELKTKKQNTDLAKTYPDYIKGIFDPGGETNTLDLAFFTDELINLGVNTYFVIGEYEIKNNKAELFMPYISKTGSPSKLSDKEAKEILADRILMAKEKGLSVILVPDYPSVFDQGRDNYNIEKIDPELKRVALELAQIAQDYNVEYFAPVNEYEHLLVSNGYTMDEIKPLFEAFYADLIPQIKKIYNGKIIIKCGNVGNWENFPELSIKNADLFGVGNAYATRKGGVAEDISEMAKYASEVSERDNTPWFISEFLVFNPEDQEEMMGEVRSEITTDEAYQEGTESFRENADSASGFSFMGWIGTGKIRSTDAVDHVKNLFDSK